MPGSADEVRLTVELITIMINRHVLAIGLQFARLGVVAEIRLEQRVA